MKKTLVSGFTALIFIFVMAIPVFANSSSWNIYDYDGRWLYGSVNHAMTAGNLKVTGEVWNVGANNGSAPTPNQITITVWKANSTGGNTLVGTGYATPPWSQAATDSFVINAGSVVAGNYKLNFDKGGVDNWIIEGTGKLETTTP
ncbi:hypothetical protein [Cohnella sp. GCM10012308]|uniref:hypothetical protein n=1 Tax=Cohnella sp. GCM10012308 TaxID=3317329 RepID=UPI00360B7DF5